MQFRNLPVLIRFLVLSVAANVVIFIVLRLGFFLVFYDPFDSIPTSVLLKSFYMGLKLDMRLVLLIHLPVLLLGWVKPFSIVSAVRGRQLWAGYLVFVNSVILLLYFTDFGHYAYLENRIDATAIRFLYNPLISFQMVWESYPIVRWMAVFCGLVCAYTFFVRWLLTLVSHTVTQTVAKWKKITAVLLIVFLYLFGIYGKFAYYPLRWSDAFFSIHVFASDLALNPVLYFFSTLKNREINYDEKKVHTYYDSLASYLGVNDQDRNGLDFIRVRPAVATGTRPNVIMVFLESFAYYKTSLSGNPLDPTPHFEALSKQGLNFDRFYTPHSGTARSIFAAVTGIPDVDPIKTSSRNPLVVQQHTIINSFEGYENFYFLGGSANWAEIRGLLASNIPRLNIYEEGSYTSERVDGWGISDLHLFEEANTVLREVNDRPFFAIIQTSGNHRPYTIPDDNRGFKALQVKEDDAVKYGFESVKGYNAARFMDHSIKFLIETSRREKYFDNTIFIFFGDHGSSARHPEHMAVSEEQLRLTRYHVPMLIFSPSLIKKPKAFDMVASELDVLPTLAGLASVSYVNSTFGRDLLDPRYDDRRYAFTIKHSSREVGLVGDEFYFVIKTDGTNMRLHRYDTDNPLENLAEHHPDITAELKPLCLGMYETALWLRYHNSPETVQGMVNELQKKPSGSVMPVVTGSAKGSEKEKRMP